MAAFAGLVLIHLHFPEAGSLKGKRKELSSLKAQLQGRLGVSVSEVDHQVLVQRSTLAVALTGDSEHAVRERVDRVDRFVTERCPDGSRILSTVVSFQ